MHGCMKQNARQQPERKVSMADKCERCTVGMIGTKTILSGCWRNAAADFDKVIDDWNEKTKRVAVPHPGFANKFEYCPQCGSKVDD